MHLAPCLWGCVNSPNPHSWLSPWSLFWGSKDQKDISFPAAPRPFWSMQPGWLQMPPFFRIWISPFWWNQYVSQLAAVGYTQSTQGTSSSVAPKSGPDLPLIVPDLYQHQERITPEPLHHQKTFLPNKCIFRKVLSTPMSNFHLESYIPKSSILASSLA